MVLVMRSVLRYPCSLSLVALVSLAGCPRPEGALYAVDPLRAKGLPRDPEELISISDSICRIPAFRSSLRENDRALAALEVALYKRQREDFEILWRLSRASFRMTELLENKQQRLRYAEAGVGFAERARKANAVRVEAHYFLALNAAKVAEAKHKLGLIKDVIAIAELAGRIDGRYDEAGPYRLLGKVYLTAPAWPVSVGSPEKAIEVLERAVSLVPAPTNRLFLGQAYYHDEEYEKARTLLTNALKHGSQIDPRWRKEAEEYLRRIRNKTS
jgi:tetratricopeptide (TPR) repeat protein